LPPILKRPAPFICGSCARRRRSGGSSGSVANEAARHPAVAAVWTAADVAGIPPIGFRLSPAAGLERYRQPILARDHVRYVGEPLAAVFAADPYAAEDAADLVEPEIEPLSPDLDLLAVGGETTTLEKGYGDIAAAFANAYTVIEIELETGRHAGVPLETRGAVAVLDADGVLRLFGAAQVVPHYNRQALAAMLGLAPAHLHLHEGHVGGGFGIRGELYPEDVLVCAAALRLGRPVKWIEDRWEHLVAANQSRGQLHRVRAAVDAQGFLMGLDDEFWFDILLFEDAPTPLNPLGVKGAGEAGIAAVDDAVDDAIGRPGAVRRLPIRPQRLHRHARG
jgi:aerobic carbon-monoxide dehydrogenase large subunit